MLVQSRRRTRVATPLLSRFAFVAGLILAISGYVGLAAAQSGGVGVSDEDGIRGTLAAYNRALNGGKTAMVLPLYSQDGVFMPPYSPSAIGRAAVGKAYDAVFEELTFHVEFNIAVDRCRYCLDQQLGRRLRRD